MLLKEFPRRISNVLSGNRSQLNMRSWTDEIHITVRHCPNNVLPLQLAALQCGEASP